MFPPLPSLSLGMGSGSGDAGNGSTWAMGNDWVVNVGSGSASGAPKFPWLLIAVAAGAWFLLKK